MTLEALKARLAEVEAQLEPTKAALYRIDGAIKKFEKGYPELKSIQALRREELRMAIAPMESLETEPIRNGPVIQFNPQTLQRRKIQCNPSAFRREMIRPGVDIKAIAQWARDRAPKQRFH